MNPKICVIPECNNIVTRNGNTKVCEEHISGIKIKCEDCGKELILKCHKYINNIKNNTPIICGNCSSKRNMTKYISSENGKKHIKNLNETWGKSETNWRNNLVKYSKSDKGKEHSKKRITEYNKSKEGQIHIKENLKNIQKNWLGSEENLELLKENRIKSQKTLKETYYGTEKHIKQYTASFNKCHEVWSGSEDNLKLLKIIGPKGLAISHKTWNYSKENLRHLTKIREKAAFNGLTKEQFYASDNIIISFNSINKTINLEDIENFKYIKGVWSIWGIDENNKEICLEVCETQNIGKEIKCCIRLLETGNNNLNKTNAEIKESRKHYNFDDSNKRIKYRNIAEYKKYGSLIFKLIIINVEKQEKRWNIEAQYAKDNKAKYWNPAPMQKIY